MKRSNGKGINIVLRQLKKKKSEDETICDKLMTNIFEIVISDTFLN